MLDELRICDVGVIADVDLRTGPGLTVVTGETGAGKTMVVWALELLLGARADAVRIRAGADRAVVEARFVPAPAAATTWQDTADELVVSREVARTGDGVRSRARLGGRLAPVAALGDVLADHVEIHGQHDTHRLADVGVQRELLDRFGGDAVAGLLTAYREVFDRWRTAVRTLDTLVERSRERAREADRLAAELAEIDEVAPGPAEDVALDAQLRRLEHAEALLDAARTAAQALVGDGGARDHLGVAVAALRPVADVDEVLRSLTARAEAVAAEAQELGIELGDHADGLDLDPRTMDDLRTRRMTLGRLTRKYGADIDAVRDYAEEARARHAELGGDDRRRDELAAEVARLQAAVADAAGALTASRREAGRHLGSAVDRHLGELAMAGAAFVVDIADAEPGPHGADRVRFLLRAGAGQPVLPMADAASGGERSRVALALRLALAEADRTPVLVFDEVDAGVGGRVALAVGEKLARLARDRQVLCVTHQAQLAAHADQHVVVEKSVVDGRTRAHVTVLDDAARIRELSRLLSGGRGDGIAHDHAAALRTEALQRLAAPAPEPGARRGSERA